MKETVLTCETLRTNLVST